MSQVRKYAAAGLDAAARRSRRRRLAVGALDETGQEKQGNSTAGVKRQYLGCAGRVANGINTVHLSYVREKTGHALAGARQWIPAEDIKDPVKCLVTGLPLDLRFRTKGELAIDILADAYGDGLSLNFVCGNEVYGACTSLREFLEEPRPGLRPSRRLELHRRSRGRDHADLRGGGEEAAEAQAGLGSPLRGNGVQRRAVVCLGLAGHRVPRRSLLVRRHLKTGELAFHYCFVPGGQLASKARLIRAAGLRWPAEESFELGKGCFGLDQCQARLYTAILRHIVLVMAALAVCAVTAAAFRDRTDAQAPPPAGPDAAPPADTGLIPLTVREIRRLLASATARPKPPGHAARWLEWRRRHQARSRWFHKHAHLQHNYAMVS